MVTYGFIVGYIFLVTAAPEDTGKGQEETTIETAEGAQVVAADMRRDPDEVAAVVVEDTEDKSDMHSFNFLLISGSFF